MYVIGSMNADTFLYLYIHIYRLYMSVYLSNEQSVSQEISICAKIIMQSIRCN